MAILQVLSLLLLVALASSFPPTTLKPAVVITGPQAFFKYSYYSNADMSDILKSYLLVDFSLSVQEFTTLHRYYHELTHIADDDPKYLDKRVRSIQNVFDPISFSKRAPIEDMDKIIYPHLNMLLLAINYNMIAQILDPDYKENLLTIPLSKDYEKTETQKEVLALLLNRWAPNLTGVGVTLPSNNLENFYVGTKEDILDRQYRVLEIYFNLDHFVAKIAGLPSSDHLPNSDNHRREIAELFDLLSLDFGSGEKLIEAATDNGKKNADDTNYVEELKDDELYEELKNEENKNEDNAKDVENKENVSY